MARSDADIIAKKPLRLRFGVKDYEVPLLLVLASEAWREQLNTSLGGVADSFQVTAAVDSSQVRQGLTAALMETPRKIRDLVFAYAGKSLDQEEVLANSTDEQFAAAFSLIMQVAYPFLPPLRMVTEALRRNAAPPQLAKSSN
jgi:hypothetical protein